MTSAQYLMPLKCTENNSERALIWQKPMITYTTQVATFHKASQKYVHDIASDMYMYVSDMFKHSTVT